MLTEKDPPVEAPDLPLPDLLKHLREAAGMTQAEEAERLCAHTGTWTLTRHEVGRWEQGRVRPGAWLPALAQVLGVELNLLERAPSKKLAVASYAGPSNDSEQESELLRRTLLAGIAGIGVSAVTPLEGLEQLRTVVDRNVGAPKLAEWEEAAWEYDLQRASRPPLTVAHDLSLDVLAFQQAMGHAPNHETYQWRRLNARFMLLLAATLGSAGYGRESRHWWASARRAAEQTGDHQLAAMVHASEAVQGLYEERPLALVLSRVDTALELTKGRPCQATAQALSARAYALVLAGDHASACAALNQESDVYDALPDHVTRDQLSMDGWPLFRLLHTRSLVYALSGHPRAAQAQKEALAAQPARRPRQRIQVRLHEAIFATRDGDVDDGLDHARRTLADLGPNTNLFVKRIAAQVADAAPSEAQSHTAVLDYRRQFALPQGEA
ncbi:helix-turn-helix domain-containing protein [Streptosporangium saharense]|uniref:Transcriptional regulator with XRE-family HTH domain n=1 Tax=Streptosporangium saharense TaxID=1706840 RepID=A0A7W7QUG9_9ACTN|nr:helix-turn-helix transcriptional regulator [Streptosporangium saharense]MBB4919998.1 transcriptional regulator with XRE-family HTH domain [Streptosporangium saharense]